MTTNTTTQQIQSLMNFIARHQITELVLDQTESSAFFGGIPNTRDVIETRLFLQQAMAEGITYRTADITKKVIISREQIIGDIEFYAEYSQNMENSTNFYNPFVQKLLQLYIERLDLHSLLTKLATQINQRFPISQGQARAVLFKTLGFKLDSGTRSFLHDLRTKIRKYKELVMQFEEYVKLPNEDELSLNRIWLSGEIDDLLANDFLEVQPSSAGEGRISPMLELIRTREQILRNVETTHSAL